MHLCGAASLGALLVLSACAPPIQNGGVYVVAGAGDRFSLLCKFRKGGEDAGNLCESPEANVPPARVSRLKSSEDALRGPLATARPGDLVLENNEVVFVIAQMGAQGGVSEGGAVIDAGDAHLRGDELTAFRPCAGAAAGDAVYDQIKSGVDADGTAFVAVSGHDRARPGLEIHTRYSLGPLDRTLMITTDIQNKDEKTIGPSDFGDRIHWGSTRAVVPGETPGISGDRKSMYVGGVGHRISYVIAPVNDADIVSSTRPGHSDLTFERNAVLAPGATLRYERVLSIAPRGDAVAIANEFFFLQGGSPGGISVKLIDSNKNPIEPAPDGRIFLERVRAMSGTATWADAWTMNSSLQITGGANQRDYRLGGEIPPGRYAIQYEGGGRRSTAKGVVEVRAGIAAALALPVSEPALLMLKVGDTSAEGFAKVNLYDLATGTLVLGPLYTRRGELRVPIAPGRYRALVSRGPEYALSESQIEAKAGDVVRAEVQLKRVIEASNAAVCDLGVQTAWSGDSHWLLEELLPRAAAEGLSCIALTEKNTVPDPAPALKLSGLEGNFIVIPGMELDSERAAEPFGHIAVFPVEPGAERAAQALTRGKTADQVFGQLKTAFPGAIVQINHPRAGKIGFFEQFQFDQHTGAFASGAREFRFGAFSIWSGANRIQRTQAALDWMAVLRAGGTAVPTSASRLHASDDAVMGYPRTIIRRPKREQAPWDQKNIAAALQKYQNTLVTNGPFISIHIGDAEPGGIASISETTRSILHVRVERADWIDASELVVHIGGAAREPIALTGAVKTPLGALADDISIPIVLQKTTGPRHPSAGPPDLIQLTGDTFIVAEVRGNRPPSAVVTGDPTEITPHAITSALYIDADGDGRAALH